MRRNFPIKTLEDGKSMLNLGSGTKMNWKWTNLDFSPYARLSHHRVIAKILRKIGILSENRYQNILGIDPEIVLWDLRKGIPFPDEAFDVVYHSHLLEHIDKSSAPSFLKECHRVLKRGGFVRIVVPNLLTIINRYIKSISELENGVESGFKNHQLSINDLFDQMVRKERTGAQHQYPIIKNIEKLLLGDATKSGELHRWVYDKYSLEELLSSAGFKDIREEGPFTSQINGWGQFTLDANDDGSVYKQVSLYMECVK